MIIGAKLRTALLAAGLSSVLVLPGCNIVSPPPPLQIVVLDSTGPDAPECKRRLPVQIVVPAPSTAAGLETDRIAILLNGREVNYLSGYRWEDTTAHMLQRQFVDTLNGSNCYTGAGSGNMALNASYRLELDIKRMHFVYADDQQRPSAEVRIVARLVDVRSGVMLGQFTASSQQHGRQDELFASMEQAVRSAIRQTAAWLYPVIRQHPSVT